MQPIDLHRDIGAKRLFPGEQHVRNFTYDEISYLWRYVMYQMPVAVLISTLIFMPPATAQVYKCKDGAGKTIYSDAPCGAGQSGVLFKSQRTQEEIYQERIQAAEANERKYREQAARLEAQMLERQQQQIAMPIGNQAATQDRSASRECKEAQKELEFVSSIRTTSQDEKRLRTNAAITRVNASCGSNTALMQEPSKVILHPRTPKTFTDQHGRSCSVFGGGAVCN